MFHITPPFVKQKKVDKGCRENKIPHPGFRPRFQPVGLTGRREGDSTPEGENRGPEFKASFSQNGFWTPLANT